MAESEGLFEGVFLNIPSSIITDILSRLPPKAVIRCQCVCKTWLKLFSEAEFVKLHLSKSAPHLIVLNLSANPPDSPLFNLVQVEDENDHHGIRRIAPMDSEIQWSQLTTKINMINSINGLICILDFSNEHNLIHVWNPIMGEYITVETPKWQGQQGQQGQETKIITNYGFGFSSGNYRLVMICREIEIIDSGTDNECAYILDSTCHVYTIGAGSWKCIDPAPLVPLCGFLGVFLNGNIHWPIKDDSDPDDSDPDDSDSEQICCFNLDTEMFQSFPSLPDIRPQVRPILNIYKGCLSVCDNKPYEDIVIWVMKEYGIQSSWCKEVIIKESIGGYYGDVFIIKVFKDGEILLSRKDGAVFSYHPHTKTVHVIDTEETMIGPCNSYIPCIQVREYVPSVVSLKNLGEVNVNRS